MLHLDTPFWASFSQVPGVIQMRVNRTAESCCFNGKDDMLKAG
jgi:hypothetical protein